MPELDVALRELGRHDRVSADAGLRRPSAIGPRRAASRPRRARMAPPGRDRARRPRRRGRRSPRGAARPHGDPRLARPARRASSASTSSHRRRRRASRPGAEDHARGGALWLLVPDDEPDSIYVGNGTVSLLWGTPDRVRLLLTEFRGEAFIEKLIEPSARVERVTVNGEPGAWIEEPHVVFFEDVAAGCGRARPASRARRFSGSTARSRSGSRATCRRRKRSASRARPTRLPPDAQGSCSRPRSRCSRPAAWAMTAAAAGGSVGRRASRSFSSRRTSARSSRSSTVGSSAGPTSARRATIRTGSTARGAGRLASAAPGRQKRQGALVISSLADLFRIGGRRRRGLRALQDALDQFIAAGGRAGVSGLGDEAHAVTFKQGLAERDPPLRDRLARRRR